MDGQRSGAKRVVSQHQTRRVTLPARLAASESLNAQGAFRKVLEPMELQEEEIRDPAN